MRVAFLHVEEPTHQPQMQRDLAEVMIRSVKACMDVEIMQMTDTHTKPLEGVDAVQVLKIESPWLMPYRLKHLAMLGGQNIVLDTDIIVRDDLGCVFDDEFDVALTRRDVAPIDGLDMPYNIGVMFSSCQEFWDAAYEYCLKLPENHQQWFGDQLAVKHLAESGCYKVKELDCGEWNYSPGKREFSLDGKKVLHFKGPVRKAWMLCDADRYIK